MKFFIKLWTMMVSLIVTILGPTFLTLFTCKYFGLPDGLTLCLVAVLAVPLSLALVLSGLTRFVR